MATNKGDVQDALRAVRLHLAKGLGLAPSPGSDDRAPNVALATANTLLAAAITAADSLPNLQRANVQAIGVTSAVTAVLTP